MPGLSQRNDCTQFGSSITTSLNGGGGSVSVNGFWSKQHGDISYNQLQKFWGELSPQARQELLKIDKQTLFEQTRKNMYCSRCNGLLLEGFLQIVMYGKSLLQDGAVVPLPCNRVVTLKSKSDSDLCVANGCQDDLQDPSVHPWGGPRQCPSKRKRKGATLSRCLWWWRSRLDKSSNDQLWERAWDERNVCTAYYQAFC